MAFTVQKISDDNKTAVTFNGNTYDSIVFTNTHASNDITIALYVTSLLNTKTGHVTSTAVYAAETEVASTSSVTLTVDNGSGSASVADNDLLLNEKVYKSDGTLFGTCTTVTSTTALVFSGGLNNKITDNDILYTGTRFYFLKKVKIPNGTSLKLSPDEITHDNNSYVLYIKTESGTGDIDIITRY